MAEIIQISELRIQRIRKGVCPHNRLGYDEVNQHIECLDCKLPVQPFKAFMTLVRHFARAEDKLESRRKELKELEDRADKGLLKATRYVDQVWRSRKLVPCCPHCGRGILLEDNLGAHQVGKQRELERRKFEKVEK